MSIMLAFGISIALVEKGKDFPIRYWRIILQLLLSKIHWKMPQMLFCTTCTSFWASLISDIVMCILNFLIFGTFYFFWPFSGFIVLGITWFSIEFLNAIDRE
jgi:hypothetical protein